MSGPRLVLMVPLRRCGSNAIRLRMNLHPDFYSPYPLHLCDMTFQLKNYGDLQVDNNYFRLIVDMIGLQSLSLVKWNNIVFDPLEIFNRLKNKPRNIYTIYGELLLYAGKTQNAKIVMDKSQDSICDFEEIVEIFPDILFIDIVRDPRSQVSSMNQAIIYDFDAQLNTLRWIESRKWVDRIYEKYPNKIITLRYEDFIHSQQDFLTSICQFLDIPFNPLVLDVQRSKEAFEMSRSSPLWETNYSPPLSKNINKYMDYLTIQEIEWIENSTLPWMKKYNYTPITPHKQSFTYSLQQAQRLSDKNKETIWDDLKKKYPFDFILRQSRMRYIRSLSK